MQVQRVKPQPGAALEYVGVCPLCQDDNALFSFPKKGLSYSRCKRCDLLFADPRPAHSTLFSRSQAFASVGFSSQEEANQRLEFQRGRVGIILPYLKKGRLLDVGAGNGAFMRAAKDAGFDVEGVEISSVNAGEASKWYGLSPRIGSVNEILFEPDTFDAITMWDVIEHLSDPLRICQKLFSVLAPGGYLIFDTPHTRGLSARLAGSAWWVFGPWDHLCLFSKRACQYLLRQANFDSVATFSYGLTSPWGDGSGESFVGGIWDRLGLSAKFLSLIRQCDLGDSLIIVARKKIDSNHLH